MSNDGAKIILQLLAAIGIIISVVLGMSVLGVINQSQSPYEEYEQAYTECLASEMFTNEQCFDITLDVIGE